ncbi:MAG: aminotransferase [Bauldia sp.]|nr:aminotransferase [Bauldia sp.]
MARSHPTFTGMPATIFETMSQLALEHGAINLGQGFPDVDGAEDVRRVAAEALIAGPNQYPSMRGVAELRQAVAENNARFYGLDVDWRSEVLVTSGATEALADCLLAVVEPGDEVVLFEPLYDCYAPMVRRLGGVPRFVRLEPPLWRLDRAALDAAFSPRTKAVILNDPMNPAGKLFTDDERALIAAAVVAHDAIAICDEVYEHIVFDGARHRPLMAFPNMRERTARIGSAGKTLGLTGWKVGYITAAPDLMDPILKAHQFNTFTTAPALQIAVAAGLRKDEATYRTLAGALAAKRDRLAAGLAGLGATVAHSAGTIFLTADFGRLAQGSDAEICRRMTMEARVAAIPVSAFYETAPPRSVLRFCFSKRDAVLDEAVLRLDRWLNGAAVAGRAAAG